MDKLFIIWSSGDREVAFKLVYMYAANSLIHGWWDRVRLVVWGPSAKLLCDDGEVAAGLEKLRESGVELMACKRCAELYGVVEELEALGLDVHYVGTTITEMLKSDWKSVTF